MSDSQDKDDWSDNSASLFRDARRAHDPTLAESARLAAVLARIQAGKAEASLAADPGTVSAVRRATAPLLPKLASVALGVVCIAVASFAFIRANRQVSQPTGDAAVPAPSAVEAAPTRGTTQPEHAPSVAPGAAAQPSAAPEQSQPRPRSQRPKSRAPSERPRTSRIDVAPVPEASGSDTDDDSTSATTQENSATQHPEPEPRAAVKVAAANQAAAPRATSFQSNAREAAPAAARQADFTQPAVPRTELGLMKDMQAALRDADFATVLALCAEHARRWPHGVFELEREGVRAIASCGGNSRDAALRAKRFLTAHPNAPVAMRVSTACAAHLAKR